jgi:putative addiction module CopG family antidote
MVLTLTGHDERMIKRLIESGHFAKRSEVIRAGLRLLDEKNLEHYLHPAPLKPGVMEKIYREQSQEEQEEELAAARACYRPLENKAE